jgi:hypothetical protein
LSEARGRVVLACGGYRSGSTLQYNLAGEYLERMNLGRRIGLVEPPAAAMLRGNWSIVDAIGLAVAKCHHATELYRDWGGAGSTWRELVREGRAEPLYTFRDWRDVAASMCRKFGLSLEELFESTLWRENLANMEAWIDAGAIAQSYADLLDDPVEAIRAICAAADVEFDRDVAVRAAEAAAVPRQLERMRLLQKDRWHPSALIHRDHVVRPHGGWWRCWTPAEERLAQQHLGELMLRFA